MFGSDSGFGFSSKNRSTSTKYNKCASSGFENAVESQNIKVPVHECNLPSILPIDVRWLVKLHITTQFHVHDEIDEKHIDKLKNPTYENLMKIAIYSSDAVIKGSENISSNINDYLKNYKNPILNFQPIVSFAEHYLDFYNNLLST